MKKLILKLIQKYFLKVPTDFRIGDLVFVGDNQHQYELVGVYYSYELQPFLFVRDDNGRIFGAPIDQCRTPYTR